MEGKRVTRIEQVQTSGEGERGRGKVWSSFCDYVIIGCPQNFQQVFVGLQRFCLNDT